MVSLAAPTVGLNVDAMWLLSESSVGKIDGRSEDSNSSAAGAAGDSFEGSALGPRGRRWELICQRRTRLVSLDESLGRMGKRKWTNRSSQS